MKNEEDEEEVAADAEEICRCVNGDGDRVERRLDAHQEGRLHV